MRYSVVIPFTIWLLIAAGYDAVKNKFPNWLGLIGLAAYPINFFLLGCADELLSNWTITLAALIFSLIMLVFDVWGAGDTKFVVILFLWFPSIELAVLQLVVLLVVQIGIIIYKKVSKNYNKAARVPLIPFFSLSWLVWAAMNMW
jgi:Flp pilus assembly protein protease CpaA